jgi:hypothetical protein
MLPPSSKFLRTAGIRLHVWCHNPESQIIYGVLDFTVFISMLFIGPRAQKRILQK